MGMTVWGHLRTLLFGIDFAGALLAWAAVLVITSQGSFTARTGRTIPIAAALSAVMVILMAAQKLYRARTCSMRAVEVAGVGRSAALCAVAAVALHKAVEASPAGTAVVLGAVCSFGAVTYLRGVYASRLRAFRSRGLLARPVCVLGTNDEAQRLVQLLEGQPELGFRVVAVLGDPATWEQRELNVPAMDYSGDPAVVVHTLRATGVIIAVTAVAAHDLDRIVRQLVTSGLHVQVSTGLTRVGHQRLQVSPLSHQVLFYVEPTGFAAWQLALKRTIDIVLTSMGLVLLAPLLAGAALAIKLDDGGPVFYRQTRVGRHGQHFEVLKLRTMVPNASAQLAALVGSNERHGPLFKLSDDPRVTRVGRVLRATSLDELPQLVNVLRGQMSLVGPRPALPSEVAQFDAELLERSKVPAGITGLWQVEARDNPSFDAYRRLDLFYVDNWSLTMDLAILATTLAVVAGRAVRALRSGREEMYVTPGQSGAAHATPTQLGAAPPPLDAPGVYSN
jgi:exopolysaccharide biosynthesis polyprenyl glycosylphosphotransferase